MLMDTTVMIIFRLITGEILSFLSIDISTSIASLFPKHQYCSIYQLRERARINRACSYQQSVLVYGVFSLCVLPIVQFLVSPICSAGVLPFHSPVSCSPWRCVPCWGPILSAGGRWLPLRHMPPR